MLSLQDRCDIAQRAEWLDERLATARPRNATPADAPTPMLLRSWQRAFSGDDRNAFVQRLAWDGFDLGGVVAAIASSGRPQGVPPAWTTWLLRFAQPSAALSRELAVSDLPLELGWLASTDEPPFVELWLPIVRAISTELQYTARALYTELVPGARHAFERAWLRDVAAVGRNAAWDAFQHFDRPTPTAAPAETAFWRVHRGASERYDAFVGWQLREGLAPLFLRYPVLARHLATIAQEAVASSHELLARLDTDRPQLAALVNGGRDLGPLINVDLSHGDPHDGRRRVAELRFADGSRVVYKPRDVSVDRAFNDLLRWLRCRDPRAAAPDAALIERQGYGWMEWVEPAPCRDATELTRWFEAAGVLLAAAWAAGARDLHWENIVATRSGPVAVDLESVMLPEGFGGQSHLEFSGGSDDCLASELLVSVQGDGAGHIVNVGGLTGTADGRAPMVDVAWQHLRTDRIAPHTAPRPIAARGNRPRLNGSDAIAGIDLPSVLRGYERAFSVLMQSRDELTGAGGLLDQWFRGGVARVVFRPSARYGQALDALTEPVFLRDGLAASVALDSLNRVFAGRTTRPRAWPLAVSERRALERRDVPRFTVRIGERSIREAASAGAFYHHDGLEVAAHRLAIADGSLLSAHRARISDALARPVTASASPAAPLAWPQHAASSRATADTPKWLDAATWVAGQLAAHTPSEGSHLSEQGAAERLRAVALYEGRVGPALAFAALQRIDPSERWHGAMSAHIGAVLQWLDQQTPASIDGLPLGVTSGIGSVVYGLAMLTRLAPEVGLRDALRHATDLFELAIARNGERGDADVSGGMAGALLALLATADATTNRVSPTVESCGRWLVERQSLETPVGGWCSMDGRTRLGFAHGASGIAFALLRLARETGDGMFDDSARLALRLEASRYSRVHRTFPAYASTSHGDEPIERWMNAWCYGATGTALALALAHAGATGDDRALLGETLASIATARWTMADHLCCGNFGRADVLLTIGERMRRADDVAAASRLASTTLAAAADRGGLCVSTTGLTYDTRKPGFFQGLSGILYHLVRHASREPLPSVLGFEITPLGAARTVTHVVHRS